MSSAKVAAILPGLNVLINSMAGKASSQDISSRRIGLVLLTHWGRDKMATIFQTMFLNEFSWMKMYVFWLNFHWNLLARDQLTSTMVHIMAWRRPGNKPLSEPMMVNLLTDIWVTRPQWAKETSEIGIQILHSKKGIYCLKLSAIFLKSQWVKFH